MSGPAGTDGDAPAQLLLSCSIGEEDLEVQWHPEPLRYPPEMEAMADAFWQKACSAAGKNALLFDGALCALKHYRLANGRLVLGLTRTSYRYVLLAEHHTEDILRRWGEQYMPQVLGVSAVVVTMDGALPLMVRAKEVGEFPGYTDVFGGHIEPEGDSLAGKPHPFVAIRNELREELRLRPQHISSLRCIGIIRSRCNQKPELVFVCHVAQDYRTLRRAAMRTPRCGEIDTIVGTQDEATALADYLDSMGSMLTPSAYGSLWLYGIQRGFFPGSSVEIH